METDGNDFHFSTQTFHVTALLWPYKSKLPCLCSVCRGVPHNIGEACFFVQSIVWHLVFMDQIRTLALNFLAYCRCSATPRTHFTHTHGAHIHIQVLRITDHFRFDWNVMIRRTLQTNILNDFFVVLVSVRQIWFVFLLLQCFPSVLAYNLSIGFFYSTQMAFHFRI